MADIATVGDSIEVHVLKVLIDGRECRIEVIRLSDNRQYATTGGDQFSCCLLLCSGMKQLMRSA